MATVDFGVSIPSGTLTGNVDGFYPAHISSYTATSVSGYALPSDVIFCVQPDVDATSSVQPYTVTNGISSAILGLSTNQVNALEAVFSHYFDGGSTSADARAITMVADWTIVKPTVSITIGGGTISQADITAGQTLAANALAGSVAIDPNLQFLTLSNSSYQDFINVSEVPVPPALGLFMSALVMLAVFGAKKRFSLRRASAG